MLRRWKHRASLPGLHVVGLSATLTDAANHLARVADLRPDVVQEFLPSHDEIQEEGIEYSLAVKGSAAAGTSLLSTSIQATMLMARSLTPRQQPPTNPASPIAPERLYGRKVFGFSDNLDGVNRWMSDMLDAEQQRRLARLRLHPAHQRPHPAQRAGGDRPRVGWSRR